MLEIIVGKKLEENKEIFQKIFETYYRLGLSYEHIFIAIDKLIYLLKNRNIDIISEKDISTLENLLKESLVTVYIENLLNDTVKFIESEEKFKISFPYDEYVFNKIKEFFSDIKIDFENFINNNTEIFSIEPVNSDLHSFLNGLMLEIISFEENEKKINLNVLHKEMYSQRNNLFIYLKRKEYKKSLYTLNHLLNLTYQFLEIYTSISLYWNKNKETIVSSFSASSTSNKNKYLLILSDTDKKRKSVITKQIYKDLYDKYFQDFKFIFIEYINDEIVIFLNSEVDDFEEKYNNLMENIKVKAEEIKQKWLSIDNRPILKIAKLNLSLLKDKFTNVEIAEIFKQIRYDLEKENKGDIILIKDYDNILDKIYEEAKINLSIKKIVNEQLDNIELFGHKIMTLNNEVFAYEILSRMKNPENNEYIPASKFIKILIEEKLMTKFDKMVLKKLKNNLDKIKTKTDRIFVNLYPESFDDEVLIEEMIKLDDACKKIGIDLVFEVTEYTLVTSQKIVELLEKEELKLAIDDFGVGYTNFELVGELTQNKKVSFLKIDGSIVKKSTDKVYGSILESITLLSSNLGIYTVFEFIENEEILENIKNIIKKYGIDSSKILLQGFLLHVPENILN